MSKQTCGSVKNQGNRDAKGRFRRGASGNPDGRPQSLLGKYRQQLADNGTELINRMLEMARSDDPETALPALRWCCDRLVGPVKARSEPVPVALTGETLSDQARAALSELAAAKIGVEDAAALLSALANVGRIVEAEETKAMIQQLREEIHELSQQLNRHPPGR